MFSLPMRVSRSIDIAASPETVYESLGHFSEWKKWSPWLCLEDCPKVEIESDPLSVGHKQSWSGAWIGSGTMVLEDFEPAGSLHYDLQFLAPWKSRAKTCFVLNPSDVGTKLTWKLDSGLPIFLFMIKKLMQVLVGRDYERGLLMIKEYLETGAVKSVLKQNGETNEDAFYYYGIRQTCKMSEIGTSMAKSFSQLSQCLAKQKVLGRMGSLYHKVDMVKDFCDYSVVLMSAEPIASPPEALTEQGLMPAHRSLQVEHTGTYEHLGNAWASLITQQRARRLKPSKTVPTYEVYENSPGDVAPGDLKTQVYLPLAR